MPFAPYPPTVPDVIGMFYPDAQATLLAAGFLTTTPTFVLPGTPVPSLPQQITAGSADITAGDSGPTTAGSSSPGVASQLRGYVVNQSVPPGTQTLVQTIVAITVIGLSVIAQPGVPVPVP